MSSPFTTLIGASVLFNGIRVGEVTGLVLNPDNPRQVTATIAVAASTPVRADTQIGLAWSLRKDDKTTLDNRIKHMLLPSTALQRRLLV